MEKDLVGSVAGYSTSGLAGIGCELDGRVLNGQEGLEGFQLA